VIRLLLPACFLCAAEPLQDSVATVRPASEARTLAEAVIARFAEGSPDDFGRLFPFEPGRELVGWAAQQGKERSSTGTVLHESGDGAVLFLTGLVHLGNSGDETAVAQAYSGLYRARRGADGTWSLVEALPAAEQVRVLAHELEVELDPGRGLSVSDSMTVAVKGDSGFLLGLNHRAEIASVELGGAPARHLFGGGRLWIEAAPSSSARLVLRYRIDVSRDAAAEVNSGRFEEAFGHVRNQYFWHPFVGFDDAADFRVTVRAPAGIRVATDLPQRESETDGTRTVEARSETPVPALSLFYDRDWQPVELELGRSRFVAFTTPDFTPAPAELAAAFEHALEVLGERFGEPRGGYIAVVQQRARPGAGWPFLSNCVIAASRNGGPLMTASPRPRAFFGHEVAHLLTHPSGTTRNFLGEGWATYAESWLLEETFGPEVEERFWESQREQYLGGSFDGRVGLASDDSNGGVSYCKGAWVLRMLEDEIGRTAFDAGLRSYMAIEPGAEADYPQFLSRMSAAAGRDMGPFLDPWVRGTAVPRLEASIEGERVVVSQVQEAPLFRMTVGLRVAAGDESQDLTVLLDARHANVEVPPRLSGRDVEVTIDPDRRLLLRP